MQSLVGIQDQYPLSDTSSIDGTHVSSAENERLEVARAQGTMKNERPLNAFTCFEKLPIELRLVIWELASPDPRIVHIFLKGYGNRHVP